MSREPQIFIHYNLLLLKSILCHVRQIQGINLKVGMEKLDILIKT